MLLTMLNCDAINNLLITNITYWEISTGVSQAGQSHELARTRYKTATSYQVYTQGTT